MKHDLSILFFVGLMVWNIHSLAQPTFCQHAAQHLSLRGDHDYYAIENLRSDTLDILKYTIDLDMTMLSAQQISAGCTIDLKSKMDNVQVLHLDLLDLTVDSVASSAGLLTFTQSNPNLYITLPYPLNTGDPFSLTVYYHGHPARDASWGGFYFTSGYAFNLGAAFTDDPHSFGRCWFPCFDNFVERSRFAFHILTNGGRTAYCNGVKTGVETVGSDSLLTHWVLNQEIPAYLASIAVAQYTHVSQQYESITGDPIPIWLIAKPSDTTAFKQSFIHLNDCLQGFEYRYGTYRWPKVGFTSVPFNGGAMEHATNIAYPLFAINGNTAYETLYAHELSHHWWGNLITCRTAEDMWINEGWASYSESLFKEWVYGKTAYDNYVRANHKYVLTRTPKDDGGYFPVSGIPHHITYGSTVYQKGADVVHTLRGYMGDIDFFNAIRHFLSNHPYTDVSSEDLRDGLQSYTNENLTHFFDNWIFSPGFPEFRVGSYTVSPQGNHYEVEVNIDQFKHHNNDLCTEVPLTVTLMDENFQTFEQRVYVSGEMTTVHINSPIAPDFVLLNRDEKLNYAVLAEEKWIHSTGTNNLSYAEMDLSVSNLGGADSIWIRVENHWATANHNAFIPFTDYYISPDRWWLVESNMSDEAGMTGKIKFYGNNSQINFYDPLFFEYLANHGMTENDLIVLYRPDGAHPWEEWPNFTIVTSGSATNWAGRIDIQGLRPGQYAWAVHTGTVSVNKPADEKGWKLLRPNENEITFISGEKGHFQLFDTSGRLVFSGTTTGSQTIQLAPYARGKYILSLNGRSTSFIR